MRLAGRRLLTILAAAALFGCTNSGDTTADHTPTPSVFSPADLVGTWRGTMFSTDGTEAYWGRFAAEVDPDGLFSTTSVEDMLGGPGDSWPRALLVDGDGMVGFVDYGLSGFLGKMSASKQLVVGTGSSANTRGPFLFVLQKAVPGVTYSVADLAGTWDFHRLSAGSAHGWERGVLVVDPGGIGTITSIVTAGGTSTVPEGVGALTLDASGRFAADPVDGGKGFMSADKTFIVMTGTYSGGTRADLAILLRRGGTFAQADFAGDWYFHQIQSRTYQRGLLRADAAGSGSIPWMMDETTLQRDALAATWLVGATGLVLQSPAPPGLEIRLARSKELFVATMTVDDVLSGTTGELALGVR